MFAFRRSCLILLTFFVITRPAVAMENLTVFAAASTRPVLEALSPKLNTLDISFTAIYASSAALARQIEHGAHTDAYITANKTWMDHLADRNLIDISTRQDIARNRLALISAYDVKAEKAIMAIRASLNGGRLAIANPDHVPAGRYGKEALVHTKQWAGLKDQLAPTKDVTGALMLVIRKEAPLGIVYASDIQRSSKIKTSALFPAPSHSPIVYQVAGIKGATSPALSRFLSMLSGPIGQKAFKDAGFGAKP